MPGYTTNGLPLVGPAVVNTVTLAAPAGTYTNLNALSLVAADTARAAGTSPQSVAATAFQVAARALGMIQNSATSTAGAATLNTVSGRILTEALTTAAGSTYALTLTNSLLVATSAPQVQVVPGTNTAVGAEVTSVNSASGSAAITITNRGTAAFNGTLLIGFYVV